MPIKFYHMRKPIHENVENAFYKIEPQEVMHDIPCPSCLRLLEERRKEQDNAEEKV